MKDLYREHIAGLLAGPVGMPPENIAALIEIPREASHGDYAFPCFTLAKTLKAAPPKIAQETANKIAPTPLIRQVSAAGPYVNFFVEPAGFACTVLGAYLAEGERFGTSDLGAGQTVVLDFSSPNIAKPFGVGHLRSTVIGAALQRIHKALGYRTVGINHLGDWGTQFGKQILAFRRWGNEADLEARGVTYLKELYVKIEDAIKAEPALGAEARAWFRKLETGDAEARTLWQRFREISLREFAKVYAVLGVTFDSEAGESFYEDKMSATLAAIEAKGLTQLSEGATIVDLEPYGMPPCLLKKADEATLYATRDLSAAIYRQQTYRFDRMLYVTGGDQKLHFKQLFKVLELMGLDWAKNCRHVDFGMIRLGGEKMSTRQGRVVLLEDVLDKGVELAGQIVASRDLTADEKRDIASAVGVGAVVFHDLRTRRGKDVDFDWKLVLDYDPETQTFRGENGPYLQYMYTRLTSVLRKYGKPVPTSDVRFELLIQPEETALLRMALDFRGVLERAAGDCEPSYVSSHLLEIASTFSRYYHDRTRNAILSDNEDLTRARIVLCAAMRHVLGIGLGILGVRTLERM